MTADAGMRKAIIEAQRREHGRKALAVLPIHYPKEILTAMDILAVELWGPPGPPRGPEAGRVQQYVCAIVRNALAFLASGGADAVDGVLFPHTCDSIQGLATVAPDFGGWSKPAFRFLHPKGEDRPSARAYLVRELRALAASLEELTSRPLDPAALGRAIALHRRIDRARAELLDRRRHLPLTDRELYGLLRRGEYLWPEDHLRELDEARARLSTETVQRGVPLMVTGIVPEPMSWLDGLAGAGAFIAADDYAGIGRRLVRDADTATPAAAAAAAPADPFAVLVDRYFAAPPCSTRGADLPRRVAWLERRFDRAGAAGLVVHVPKFCEPELFDVPAIRRRFAEREVPVLVLESELEADASGQAVTRIEAFIEMLAARPAARRTA